MNRLLTIVFVVLVSACSRQRSVDTDNIVFALDSPPTNLDPRVGIDLSSGRLQQLLFSSLIKTDDEYRIQPDLAESWETPDPLTYVFHLRINATFHDGTPVTAKDVLYTF